MDRPYMHVLGRRHATPELQGGRVPKETSKLVHTIQWILYKRSYACPLLRCVTLDVGKKIMEELYEGVCSSYIGGRALVVTAIRIGYY